MTDTDDSSRWLTRQEAADYAGVSVETIKRWLRDGLLTRYTNGLRQVRVDRPELDRKLAFAPETPNNRLSA